MEKDLPKRKPTRLKNFDYSSTGAYFVTICIQDRQQILSKIEKVLPADHMVGEGLAPPAEYLVTLKPCGEAVKEQLLALPHRFSNVSIENYIIMPDHIHAIIFIKNEAGGASPSPTLNDIICAFKSLSSRICKKQYGIEKTFQRSYAEHIIRDRDDYETRKKYILENPMRWYYKERDAKEEKEPFR